MEEAVDRRVGGSPRIPLDALVELHHEGFDDPFEADGVNLGVGGLSMRAPYLPDVGERLACRFPCPDVGLVEASAEVVWSNDAGPHTGEFGLRFLDLDPEAERALRKLVMEDTADGGDYRPPAPTSTEKVGDREVVLAIDGVSSPIKAEVVAADDEILSLSQDLPFLRLKTGVTVVRDGRRGRIEAVDLVVTDGEPRLLIDIVFEDVAIVDAAPAESTLPDFAEPEPRAAEPAAAEDTAVDLAAPRDARPAPVEAAAPRAARTPDEPILFSTSVPSGEPLLAIDEASPTAAARFAALVVFVRAKGAPLVLLAWATLRRLAADARPALSSWAKTLGRATRSAREGLGPRGSRWLTGTRTVTKRALSVVRARSRRAASPKRRRTTAPPPRGSNVAAHARPSRVAEPEAVPRKNRRRAAVAAVLLVSGIAVAAYALGSGSGDDARAAELPPPATPTTEDAPETATPTVPAAPSPVEAQDIEATPPVAQATQTAPLAAAPPPMPRALAAPSREAGPMPAPTFPSLREGPRPGAPHALPEGSPYAVDVREGGAPAVTPSAQTAAPAQETGGAHFGAPSVSNGRSFLIRMSQSITEIRGVAREDGFTVTIPGSLSLDRAGPIAAAHPLVERSMILNRGDHSELTIVFVAGHQPAYRVEARGSALEVVIGR